MPSISPDVRYWIIVASRDHAQTGVQGGFVQANHGKRAPLLRLRQGDGVLFYSPKLRYGENEPCQAFTAIGTVADDAVVQVRMSETFAPYRRRVTFQPCREVPIRPLIPMLSFIPDKQHWGAPFRYGLLEIPAADYQQIAERMRLLPTE